MCQFSTKTCLIGELAQPPHGCHMAVTWPHMGVTVTIVVSLPLSVTVVVWELVVHRPPLRYIRLGVFTSTPQLQSLRLSSDYTYLTDFLLPLCSSLSLTSCLLSFCSCSLSLTSSSLSLCFCSLLLLCCFYLCCWCQGNSVPGQGYQRYLNNTNNSEQESGDNEQECKSNELEVKSNEQRLYSNEQEHNSNEHHLNSTSRSNTE